jgi:hypothetical protein
MVSALALVFFEFVLKQERGPEMANQPVCQLEEQVYPVRQDVNTDKLQHVKAKLAEAQYSCQLPDATSMTGRVAVVETKTQELNIQMAPTGIPPPERHTPVLSMSSWIRQQLGRPSRQEESA